MKRIEERILLDHAGVDQISERIENWLGQIGTEKKDIVRTRLVIESEILNISDHFDQKQEGILILGKRFGTPFICFRYEGESYNPVSDENMSNLLMANLGLTPQWNYHKGVNQLYLRAPRQTIKSEFILLGAVFLAILIGLFRFAMPPEVIDGISQYALTPVSDAFMNVLNTFVRLMIFFSVVTGICSIDSLSDLSKMGKLIVSRMVVLTFLGTGLCVLIILPFYRFGQGDAGEGVSQIDKLVELIFSAFPKDMFSPFIEGSMLQIVFIAVVIGGVLLVLENKVELVKKLCEEMTLLFMQIIETICRLLPLYIFTSLLELVWKNGGDIFVKLWKPLLTCLIVCLLLMIIKLIYVCIRFRISPILLLSKTKSTILIGLVTASSSAAFSDMVNVNEKKLGISPKLNRFGMPFANLLVGSTSGVLLVVILYYLAEYYAVPVNIGWFLTLWVMCSIMCMAAPPVSGGMLVVTGMLMLQLNIPSEGLAVAGLLSIIMDFISTATKIGISHYEMMIEADKLKMLDRSVLLSPSDNCNDA